MSGASDLSKTGELIRDYLQEYPELATRTLARLIFAENPLIWNSVEACRSSVRYHRGERKPNEDGNPLPPVSERTPEERRKAQGWSRLPDSLAENFDDFVLPLACDNILLLSDIHFPFHDLKSLEIALQDGKDRKVNCIVLNGDILDMYAISRFTKDPRIVDLQTEIEMLTDFLRLLKDEFKCPVYFKWGNHEERFETFLKTRAPELLSVTEFRLDVLCKFGEIGVVEVKDKRIIKAGELAILHGHEFARSVFSPVNPARGYYLRSKRSMIAGHNHQSSEHNEKDLSGKVTTVWSTGCLCHLQPEYMPLNRWNSGYARITVNKDKTFEVDNIRIIDGRIV